MASEQDFETDSPYFPSNSIIPQTILEDLCSRFLINIPEEERKDVVRLCFQIEAAHWFYVDFYRQEQPDLSPCGLKDFTKIIFQQFPFLNKTGESTEEVFENWKKYKYSVPVYGAILLNQMLEKCVLVQPFMSRTSWGFPKGKVNKDESAFDCAIREVLEETGFDMSFFADPEAYLEHNFQDHQVRLYIVPGVPEKTVFQPQTRGEIRNIQWFSVKDLPSHKKDTVSRENLGLNPNAFFMVMPFVKGLRKWISAARQKETNPSINPAPSTVESPGNMQLQKLLAKEEQRLEQEQKRAAIERRRKQQQERFQLQHELNHPLRQHHTQQKTMTLKDYQASKEDDSGHRLSPVMKGKGDKLVYTILQRPAEESHEEEPSNPIQKLLSGTLGYGPIMTNQPRSPMGVVTSHGDIYQPYYHPQGFSKEHAPPHGTPPMSARSKQPASSPSEHSWEDKEFQFSSSVFLNFKFDTKPILACLPT